jgi:MoxR-like ATPase
MPRDSTVYPMPGGVENYDETIVDIVRHVDSESPVEDDLVGYILGIGGMESEDSAERRLSFLRQAGILSRDVNQYQVGSKGYRLLDAADKQAELFDILTKGFLGFETLLQVIADQGPTEIDPLHSGLTAESDVDWEESHRTEWRLNYLRSIGYVEFSDGEYEITDKGADVIQGEGSSQQFEPPPNPQSLMTKLRKQSAIDRDFYWVRTPERLGDFTEYIRVSTNDETSIRPHSIGPGDIIFRYVDGEVVGYASLEEPGTTVMEDGSERYRAKIHHRDFNRTVPLSEILAKLTAMGDDGAALAGVQAYPFEHEGLRDCDIGDLPQAAALHILEQGNEYRTYANFDLERDIPTDGLLDADEISLYFPDEQFDQIHDEVQEALISGEHIIFVGPPGTGKSKLAKYVAKSVCGADGYAMVTATANWSTFDTVGGYQPDRESHLEFIPGSFLARFQNDEDMPANEWLIIDEINRANVDKAFGSFFSALAGDTVATPFKSDSGEEITIIGDGDASQPVKPNHYFIPESWRVLATMNTHDKMTLYDLSYAFMRRFAFVNVGAPDSETIRPTLLENYVTVWPEVELAGESTSGNTAETDRDSNADDADGEDDAEAVALTLTEEQLTKISDFWETFQPHRSIGPAIIQNVATAVARQLTDEIDLTPPLKMYVLPQLGDLPEPTQVEAINALLEDDDLPLDDEHLRAFSSDYFGIDRAKLHTEDGNV